MHRIIFSYTPLQLQTQALYRTSLNVYHDDIVIHLLLLLSIPRNQTFKYFPDRFNVYHCEFGFFSIHTIRKVHRDRHQTGISDCLANIAKQKLMVNTLENKL